MESPYGFMCYHKHKWLNSIAFHPTFHARNLESFLTPAFLSIPISYTSHVLLILLSKWVLITSSAPHFHCQHSDPDLDLDHLAHGSLKLPPNYTSSCLSWSLQSFFHIAVIAEFLKTQI